MRIPHTSPSQAAFSILQLSIVVTIVGLLVGGVLAGESFVRANELRAVVSEYGRYMNAVEAFNDKYSALPGDFSGAQSMWGTASYCPGTNLQPSTDMSTCNGDGDGTITNTGSVSNEQYRFWQHLANAGMIEGQYSGVTGSASSTQKSLIDINVPSSKLSSGGWSMYYVGTATISNTTWFDGSYLNYLTFGRESSTSITDGYALTPEEAWHIDSKLDDGFPATGDVRTYEGATSCHDAGTSNSVSLITTARYVTSSTRFNCPLLFLTGF